MSWLTPRRAALLAAVVGCLVYANAYRNGWAVDDTPVIRQNPVAHSMGAALGAWFSPYWPPQENESSAGMHRPLVILSFAIDWSLSNGRPWWFHVVNVLLHGVVSGLVVLVALAWLKPPGALAAGLLFAIHPVHVEAVANVVGRADVMAAIGLLTAILAARRYRRSTERGARSLWMTATIAAVAFGLLSKEYAAAAIVFLALDHLLDPSPKRNSAGQLYVAVLGLTIGWLFLWRGIAGSLVETTVAAGLHGLTPGERLATAFPVQLEVLRLLFWPMRLSQDYSPQVVPQRVEWGLVASLGVITTASILALAVGCLRRAPAIAFGVLAGAATYAPLSNLFFSSGVVLAERSLYLGVLCPAFIAGWLVDWSRGVPARRAVVPSLALLSAVFVVRTVTRTPIWLDTRTVVVQGMLHVPQSFRNRVRGGRILELSGHRAQGMSEYLVAAELFDREPLLPLLSAPLALELGRTDVALSEAKRAYVLWPEHPGLNRLVVDVFEATGLGDSAVAFARDAVRRLPQSVVAAEAYLEVLHSQAAPDWQRLLAQARLDWLEFRLGAATSRLDSLPAKVSEGPLGTDFCSEFKMAKPYIDILRPVAGRQAIEASGAQCDLAS